MKLGGSITRDEQAVGKPVIAVSFEHIGITNEGLKELKAFQRLQSLNLNRCYRITDAALPEIAELKSLRSLDLIHCSRSSLARSSGRKFRQNPCRGRCC